MIRTRILAVFLALISGIPTGLSQDQQRIDSLRNALNATHRIEDKIDLYLMLAESYLRSNTDTALVLASRALTMAGKAGSDDQLGRIYSTLGAIMILKDSLDKGEACYLKAAALAEESGDHSLLIRIYMALGNRNIELDNNPGALEYYRKAIAFAEETGDSVHLSRLLNNLGILYMRMKKYAEALEINAEAMSLFQKAGDSSNIAGLYANIGSIYSDMNDLEVAGEYYRKALDLFRLVANREGIAHALMKLGILNQMMERCDTSLMCLQQSLEIQRTLDVTLAGSRTIFEAETYMHMGICNLKRGSLAQATRELMHGYELAMQTRQNSLIAETAKQLSISYENQGDPGKSLAYFKVFKSYSDSLVNEDIIRRTTRLEMQYQFDARLKQREVEELEQKRRNLVFISLSGGLFLSLLILILLLKLERNKKRKVELERKSLQDELDFRNKELTTFVINNLRRSELILSVSEKLNQLSDDNNPRNSQVISDILSDLRSDSTSLEWKEFEIRFQNVYTGFYKELSSRFPDLTPNDLRLCAFLRLNMTTKDIASITYQSYNTIDVARFRLRKKLGLSKDDNLVTFLQQFQ